MLQRFDAGPWNKLLDDMKERSGLIGWPGIETISAIDVKLITQLFDQAPDVAFFVKDTEGLYVNVNDSLLSRHGLKNKSDAIGKRPQDICPGDFGQVPTDQDLKILRSGRPLIDHLEMQWHRPNRPVWCLTTKLPILDGNGNTIGIIGFSRDVQVPLESHEIPSGFAASLEHFEQHLNEIVTPSILARRAGISPQRFARLTKRLFGLSPTQLIAKTRIAEASRLLYETQQSISDIALACGFYDHSAFTRAFRSATGVSPSQYRSQSCR
jgi:PAS domain S-box-containing protein